MSKLPVALTSLALLSAALPATAQPPAPDEKGDDISIVLEDQVTRPRVRLAFPEIRRARGMSRDALAAAEELQRTLLDDLIYSRIFDVQDEEILQVLELTGDRQSDYLQYRSLGNQVLLDADIKEESGRLVLEARVYDLQNFRPVCKGKRYRGRYDQARRVAHTYNDQVVECLSGEPGIALTQIVFASDRSGFKELYMMDYDGHNQRAISGHKSFTMAPDWNPTGEGIAYASYFSGHPSIYYIDLQSGSKKPILEDGRHNFSPSMSPDGRFVALTRSLDGNSEIFTVRRDGSDLTRVTNAPRIDANPAWSPSGREIAFTSDRSGSPQLYIMDRAGGNLRRVTREGSNNDGAAWSPDGSKLAYAHRHKSGNRFDIAIIDLITLENRVLTESPGTHEAPSFSPDGERVVFESTRNGSRQIWVVDVDGRNLRSLTDEGQSFAPSWSGFME